MKRKTNILAGQRGFSLVELLVVIAVIAIIAAIAIPNIANITSNATYAKNQRNAQNLASVASAAIAAGYSGTAWTAKDTLISSLSGTGSPITVTNNGNVMSFSVSPMSTTEQNGMTNFIQFTPSGSGVGPTVQYVASGSAP